ncbi:MAG: hypothetical protein QM680_12835 [Luteolibacter sp.]
MKHRAFFVIAAALLQIAFPLHARETLEHAKTSLPPWKFCIVYQLRDTDDQKDARPAPQNTKDPFRSDVKYMPQNLLVSGREIIDIAAPSTRIVKSSILSHESAKSVASSVLSGSKSYLIKDCYNPHHLFVFYDPAGKPTAAIEVCFSCCRVKTMPEIRTMDQSNTLETADLARLAQIVSEAGLDLDTEHTLDTFLSRLKRDGYAASISKASLIVIGRPHQTAAGGGGVTSGFLVSETIKGHSTLMGRKDITVFYSMDSQNHPHLPDEGSVIWFLTPEPENEVFREITKESSFLEATPENIEWVKKQMRKSN